MNLRNVRRISFKNCQIDAERAANISLVSSETQQFFCHLDVSGNPLKDQGVNALLSAACRNENCQLRVFQFASCQLEVQGAIRISHLLQGKHRNALGSQIQILNLASNNIANVGMEALCQYLEPNKSLLYLDVSHNAIEDRGMLAAARLVQQNTTLQALIMTGNSFTGRPLPKLTVALTTNVQSRLFILHIGELKCTAAEFEEFIRTGAQFAISLRYLYLTTPHADEPCVSLVNKSSSYVSISAAQSLTQRASSGRVLEEYIYLAEYG